MFFRLTRYVVAVLLVIGCNVADDKFIETDTGSIVSSVTDSEVTPTETDIEVSDTEESQTNTDSDGQAATDTDTDTDTDDTIIRVIETDSPTGPSDTDVIPTDTPTGPTDSPLGPTDNSDPPDTDHSDTDPPDTLVETVSDSDRHTDTDSDTDTDTADVLVDTALHFTGRFERLPILPGEAEVALNCHLPVDTDYPSGMISARAVLGSGDIDGDGDKEVIFGSHVCDNGVESTDCGREYWGDRGWTD